MQTHTHTYIYIYINALSPVSWRCKIHQLHLCRGARPYSNGCPGYDIKPSDGEAPIFEF